MIEVEQMRKEKPLEDAAYYSQKYADALEKANKGVPYAFHLLGRMFEESVYHAREKWDYDYTPDGYDAAVKIYYELAALVECSMDVYYLGESYREDKDYKQSGNLLE